MWKNKRKGQKDPFSGQARSILDPPKPKPQVEPVKPKDPSVEETEPWKPKPPPEIAPEDMPGPGKRFVVVTSTPAGVPAQPPPDIPESEYKLKASDLKGVKMGEPKTFASVRKEQRIPSKVVVIKFDIRINGQIYKIDAQFCITETTTAIYEFLEQEIFEKVEKYDVILPFPRMVLARDNKTLGAQKITGKAMLQVMVSGEATLKI